MAPYSELLLRQYGKEYRIDSRTSDENIAMRTGSPIYTTEEIMKTWRLFLMKGYRLSPESTSKAKR